MFSYRNSDKVAYRIGIAARRVTRFLDGENVGSREAVSQRIALPNADEVS
jgi:hypothetical protein